MFFQHSGFLGEKSLFLGEKWAFLGEKVHRAEKSTEEQRTVQYSRADQSREEKSNRAEHSAFLTDLTESEFILNEKMENALPSSSFSIIHYPFSIIFHGATVPNE